MKYSIIIVLAMALMLFISGCTPVKETDVSSESQADAGSEDMVMHNEEDLQDIYP